VDPQKIFSIKNTNEFTRAALEIFRFQAENNIVYKNYIEQIGIKSKKINDILHIPFLPIEFFKTHKVICNLPFPIPKSHIFLSSGTTGMNRSKHYVTDISLYEKSFRKCFEIFYGDVKQYAIIALLPGYYENKNSSLLYMITDLIKQSKNKQSGFFNTNNNENIVPLIQTLLKQKQKVILFGVSFALLDTPFFAPTFNRRGVERESGIIVIETGGMKGRRKEITREELHKILCEKFGVKKIHSEYGMTELLSQAWSKGNRIFKCPPWMKVMVRDINDPFRILDPKTENSQTATGVLNIIDLANIYSCSFIATQDLGKVYANETFEVLGRTDNSDLRGCNLMA
jgi:phenylacetate-coenzyme A ligase PaaK-like adenylate-forming protein